MQSVTQIVSNACQSKLSESLKPLWTQTTVALKQSHAIIPEPAKLLSAFTSKTNKMHSVKTESFTGNNALELENLGASTTGRTSPKDSSSDIIQQTEFHPKKKYGYLGFGPNGIYHGVLEIHSSSGTGHVPSLAALAMARVKDCGVASTSSGLPLVPSSLMHSSTLVKRGQVELIESKELKSSASMPSLSVLPREILSRINKIKSSSNISTSSVQSKKSEAKKKRKVSFIDHCVIGNARPVTCKPKQPGAIYDLVVGSTSLPRKSSLVKTGADKFVLAGLTTTNTV